MGSGTWGFVLSDRHKMALPADSVDFHNGSLASTIALGRDAVRHLTQSLRTTPNGPEREEMLSALRRWRAFLSLQ